MRPRSPVMEGGIRVGMKILLSEWRPAVSNRNVIGATFGVLTSLLELPVVILDTFLGKHRREGSKRVRVCHAPSQRKSGLAPVLNVSSEKGQAGQRASRSAVDV